jgi:tetratricopeptide (TPR) repeat protein
LADSEVAYRDFLREEVKRLNSPNDAEWGAALQNLVLGQPRSIEVLLEAIARNEVNLGRASTFANFLIDRGYYNDAEPIVRAILQREPENAAYLNNLGVLLLKQGKLQEGISLLDKAVDLDLTQYGQLGLEKPAWKNRELALALLRLMEKKGKERKEEAKKEIPAPEKPQDTLQLLEEAIRQQHTWKAFWQTMLVLAESVTKYFPTIFFGFVIAPVGVVALLGTISGITTIISVYYVILGVAIITIFAVLRFLAQRGILDADLRIDSRRNQYISLFQARLQVQ